MDGDVLITVRADEALVLFAWVAEFNPCGHVAFSDQAEQRVLWDLEAELERLVAPLSGDYESQLAEARSRVRDARDEG